MSAGGARLSRRTFLRISSMLALGGAGRLPRRLVIASALPLPFPHTHSPNTFQFAHHLAQADAALVPAYLAAELIQAGALRPLNGPPNRAHDPEGAFTVPHTSLRSALIYRHAPQTPSLDDLFSPGALWPADPRLVLGAALRRRGYPLNDAHPGHLKQIEHDLRRAHPRFVDEPATALREDAGSVALTLVNVNDAGRAHLPTEGGFSLEYDWVIPRASSQPESAERLIRLISPSSIVYRPPSDHRALPTFCPLTPIARARYIALWDSL
jgi:hypothetical protein